MQRLLLIMRHGKSERSPEYTTDHDRPLASRGASDAPRMARLMQQRGVTPEIIFTSTAQRALSTALLIKQVLDGVELAEVAEMYAAGVADLLQVIRQLPDQAKCALLVGHNPGLEMLVDELTGVADTVLKTCSVAVLQLPAAHWRDVDSGSATLRTIVHPRELEA